MGIFNEQSFDHPFAKGIQGAPGVGFSLTADGNYDLNKKRLTNVGAPSANTDAATKKYVDDNSGGTPTTTRLTVDSNIDMKDRYRILNLKHPVDADEPATKQYSDSRFLDRDGSRTMIGNLSMNNNKIIKVGTPTVNDDVATKKYVDDSKVDGSDFLKIDGTRKMTGILDMDLKRIQNLGDPIAPLDAVPLYYASTKYLNLDGSFSTMTGNIDMNNHQIFNLPKPTGPKQPTPLAFTDFKYLHVAGTNKMLNNLNMDNKKLIHLRPPTSDTDAATKKYVDDNSGSPDLSDYLEKDGTVAMTGNLNLNSKKIINLGKPTQANDAVNKDYTDHLIHHTAVQPSHYADQFGYLMSSAAQWTDETNGGNSFLIDKIGILTPKNGNFHDYNHKVIYYKINKNSQGGYNYKMGMNFYRLNANTDYTLCLELLNTEYLLWHKSQISVDKGNSSGLTLGNVSIKKLSHKFTDSGNQTKFMYYYKLIINFRKLATGNRFFLHVTVNIPQTGIDLNVYPNQFKGCYMIAYGIVGTFSNIDPDKVYDYHTAFDIKPTEVVYNVDINANQKEIKNIKLDRQNDNSAATVALVKELAPFTKNALYRLYFSEVYDFANADSYGINIGSSGVIINSVKPNITLTPNKDLDVIKKDGLRVNGYTLTFNPSNLTSNYTLCIVLTHWRNRNLHLKKIRRSDGKIITWVSYQKDVGNDFALEVDRNVSTSFTALNSFNGKKIVIWLTESFNSNVAKLNISNYSSTLTLNSTVYANDQYWTLNIDDGIIYRLMSSPNFYDTDSEQYHKVMLQEKLNGSYIL